MPRVLIWDLPTRAFHWLFAACFASAWLTGESEDLFALHMFSGCLLLGLVLFRLTWGLTGGRYARFASFAFGPGQGLRYFTQALAGRAERHLGHNPAGSQAIWLLLGLGLSTATIGLAGWALAVGEAAAPVGLSGPDLADALKEVHEVLANAMFLVVLAHLAGVLLLAVSLAFGAWWFAYADFARLPAGTRDHHEQEDEAARRSTVREVAARRHTLPASEREAGMGGTGLPREG